MSDQVSISITIPLAELQGGATSLRESVTALPLEKKQELIAAGIAQLLLSNQDLPSESKARHLEQIWRKRHDWNDWEFDERLKKPLSARELIIGLVADAMITDVKERVRVFVENDEGLKNAANTIAKENIENLPKAIQSALVAHVVGKLLLDATSVEDAIITHLNNR